MTFGQDVCDIVCVCGCLPLYLLGLEVRRPQARVFSLYKDWGKRVFGALGVGTGLDPTQ